MKRHLVFIHGRSQQHKDSVALKAEWLDALKEGLEKSGLTLPLADDDVRFPYYGDTLFELTGKASVETATEVVVRGTQCNYEEEQFFADMLDEVRQKTGLTDAQIAEMADDEVVRGGALNWKWVQGILRAIDRFVPYGSGAGVGLFTKDVYRY